MNYTSPEQVKQQIQSQSAIILDIREEYEYEICSISSIKIPMADVDGRVNELPSDKNIVVMCRSGKRAEALANMLITEHDMNNVSVMEGGILSWIEKVEPHLEAY